MNRKVKHNLTRKA